MESASTIAWTARGDELQAMLTYSMSVSVDGFIADREGAFEWTVPSEEQFRFHTAQIRELGGYLCGRKLYETMLRWETDPSMRDDELGMFRNPVVVGAARPFCRRSPELFGWTCGSMRVPAEGPDSRRGALDWRRVAGVAQSVRAAES